MHIKQLFSVLILAGVWCIQPGEVLAQNEFQATLIIRDDSGNSIELTFGVDAQDQGPVDESVGDQPAPPPPPSGGLDARFVNGDHHLISDIRAPDDRIVWDVQLQNGGSELGADWNLPGDGVFVLMADGEEVNMRSGAFQIYSLGENTTQLQIVYRPTLQSDVSMHPGWNLVGLPVARENASIESVFPAASEGTLFSYSGGYTAKSELSAGEGYWLYYDQQTTESVDGQWMQTVEVNLEEGWNLIGGPACVVSGRTAAIVPGHDQVLVDGTLYGYDGGYYQVQELEAGKGYWIRASDDGPTVVGCVEAIPEGYKRGPLAVRPPDTFKRLEVRDASGNAQVLYMDGELPSSQRTSSYGLPPAPPEGSFDVRFEGNKRLVEQPGGVVRFQTSVYPLTIRLDGAEGAYLVEKLNNSGQVIGSAPLTADGALQITDESVNAFHLKKTDEQPGQFTLRGNYPNPFNPVTTVNFDLPERADVAVEVVDLTGRVVLETRRENMPAGTSRGVEVDAERLPSGTYFYRITARMRSKTATSSGRMVLIK